jgi:hypothetical protein
MSNLKIYEASTLLSAISERIKDYQNLQEQLEDLKEAFQEIVQLSDFKGKAANAIKGFYRAQIDVVNSWEDFINQHLSFFKSVEGSVTERNLSGNTLVHVPFLEENLMKAAKKSYELVSDNERKLKRIFCNIDDIISLDVFSSAEFDHQMYLAEKERKDTLEKVYELDYDLVNRYQKSQPAESYTKLLFQQLLESSTKNGIVSSINFDTKAYRNSEIYQVKKAELETRSKAKKNSTGYSANTSAMESLEKQNHKEAELKESFLEIADFDWMAPFDGTNLIGTSLDVLMTLSVGRKVLRGFEVIRDKNGNIKMTIEKPGQRKKKPKGRPRAKYKIFDDSYIYSQAKSGNFTNAAAYSKSIKIATGAALRDKLGYASIMVDIYSDTNENINNDASSDKIAGDILGNVAIGVGAIAVGGATVALLPAAAGAATIAAVGLGVSVGVTYLTEGIKWNVDLDKDGEDDSIKDMTKLGFKSGINTIAGWFK